MTDQNSNPSVLGFVILIMRKSAVMTLEDMDLIDVYNLTDNYPFKPLNMTQSQSNEYDEIVRGHFLNLCELFCMLQPIVQ